MEAKERVDVHVCQQQLKAITLDLNAQDFEGADVRFGDVQDPKSISATAFSTPVDVVVSCLASRTGGKVIFSSILSKCDNRLLLSLNHDA